MGESITQITLFLCGDVMTGRGIDQALPHPGDPTLHEPSVRDARTYIELAEQVNGPVRVPLDWSAPWGAALEELERAPPALRLVNLETAITTSDHWRREKAIHYRMHPANVPCLTAARIDGCALANNHVLDWDHPGLAQTRAALRAAHIQAAGAGPDADAAAAPMTFDTPAGRVRVFVFGCTDSGIPSGWGATVHTPGVNLLPHLDDAAADQCIAHLRAATDATDRVIVSIHWDENWGDPVPREHVRFARRLIDAGAADVIHGHSSHHPKALEVYRERLILYGCGDFIDDYEGIPGHAAHRPDLRLMYLPTLDATTGRLVRLRLVPLQAHRLRLRRASRDDAAWLARTLGRSCDRFHTELRLTAGGAIEVSPRRRDG